MRYEIIVDKIEIHAEHRASTGKNVHQFVRVGIEFQRLIFCVIGGKARKRHEEIEYAVPIVID